MQILHLLIYVAVHISLCTAVVHNTAHRTFLIIFTVNFQTNIIAEMTSVGAEDGPLVSDRQSMARLSHKILLMYHQQRSWFVSH